LHLPIQQTNACECIQDSSKTDGSCDPGGGFQIVSCVENENKDGTNIQSKVYTNSDCTGTSVDSFMPADTCRSVLGSGLKIDCSSGLLLAAPTYSVAALIAVVTIFFGLA